MFSIAVRTKSAEVNKKRSSRKYEIRLSVGRDVASPRTIIASSASVAKIGMMKYNTNETPSVSSIFVKVLLSLNCSKTSMVEIMLMQITNPRSDGGKLASL